MNSRPMLATSPMLLLKYLVMGVISVIVDASVYGLVLLLTGNPLIAKPIGYICGAVFSYFANWRFTFGERQGKHSELAFVLVYVSSLFVNLGINELLLSLLRHLEWAAPAAFLAATAVTTVWNFLGQSQFVFRESGRGDSLEKTS